MSSTKFILGMRDRFFDELFLLAQKHPELVIVSADNGAPALDKFAYELKHQFHTVGIAEQAMIGVAAGLATEGKKVYTYAIAPFVTTRVHEQVKIDLCAMNLPVVNLGVGAGYAYDVMGPSHHTVEDLCIMRVLPNLVLLSPSDGVSAAAMAKYTYELEAPQYVRFDRAGLPDLHREGDVDLQQGFAELKAGRDLCIVATGIMVHEALRAAEILEKKRGLKVGVVDLFRIKPLPQELLKTLAAYPRVVSYEEHLLAGGLGGALLEFLNDNNAMKPMLRIGQQDRFVFDNGGRKAIWDKYGLTAEAVADKALSWIP